MGTYQWLRIRDGISPFVPVFQFKKVASLQPGQRLVREVMTYSALWQAAGTAPNFDVGGPVTAGGSYFFYIVTAGSPAAPPPGDPDGTPGEDVLLSRAMTWANDILYPTGDYTQWRSPSADTTIDFLGRRTAATLPAETALWACWRMHASIVPLVTTQIELFFSSEVLIFKP